MPEKNLTVLQQQKAAKLMIEDVILKFLDGDNKENALKFVAHLHAKKIKPVWTLIDTWKATYKGKTIYRIRLLGDGWVKVFGKKYSWVIDLYLDHMNEYEETIINEGLQNILWNNVYYCTRCPSKSRPFDKPCAGGRNITILGKEIKGVCANTIPIHAFDPDENTLNGIKRLLELEQKVREENA